MRGLEGVLGGFWSSSGVEDPHLELDHRRRHLSPDREPTRTPTPVLPNQEVSSSGSLPKSPKKSSNLTLVSTSAMSSTLGVNTPKRPSVPSSSASSVSFFKATNSTVHGDEKISPSVRGEHPRSKKGQLLSHGDIEKTSGSAFRNAEVFNGSGDPGVNKDGKRAMGLGAVVSMMFFTVCGGPIGCEEVIAAGGPSLGLLFMIIFPWIYCFPVALVSAELSTEFPEDGSFTLWVASSFGRFWAFQDGYWSWISGVLDNAMYPVLATELILGSESAKSALGILLTLAISLSMSLINFAGVEMVTKVMIVLGIFVLFPYVVLIILASTTQLATVIVGGPASGYASIENIHDTISTSILLVNSANNSASAMSRTAAPLEALPDVIAETAVPWAIDWIKLLHVTFWSYSGWDSVATFAGEVKDPHRNFPKALTLSIILTCVSYVFPLAAGIMTPSAPDWRTWTEGSFHDIGLAIGGELLHGFIFISTGISLLAMYCSEMFVDSCLLLGMAEQDLMPRVFARRSAHGGAPWVAICASLAVIVVVAPLFDFTKLMEVNNCLTCMSVLIELVAAIRYRLHAESNESTSKHTASGPKPFRAPVSNAMYIAMQVPAILVILLVVSTTILGTSIQVQLWTLCLIIVGGPLYRSCALQDLRIE